MAGDSQAPFSQSVEVKRCMICLTLVRTSQCIDAAPAGKQQLRNAVRRGILADGYAEMNGIVQCPSCHSYFTANYIALSLPIPVLKYLLKYVARTPKADRKPLYKVFDLLVKASLGEEVDLPNAKHIFPYLGLFTMVTLEPTEVAGYSIPTPYLPDLSIIHGSKFVKAPSNTSPTAEKTARIFQSQAIDNNTALSHGMIPLSSDDPAFSERRYWRLPVSVAVIFAALIEQLPYNFSECKDIILASDIRSILNLQSRNQYPDGGWGPSGSGGSKRKNTGSSSSGKRQKKPRKASGAGNRTGDCGEPNSTSDFPPEAARSQNGQSHHRDIASSSRS